MDRTNMCLIISCISGIITLCVGSTYIPSVGGNVPPDKSPQEYHHEQQQAIYSSSGFKATMAGTGITIVSVFAIWIRSSMIEQDDLKRYNVGIKPSSILKVARVVPSEHVNITIEDEKPHVITSTPQLTSQKAPPLSSSPPIQLVPGRVANITPIALPGPRGPVIKLVPLVRKFRYPPPYEYTNR
jgi:hypothetical protein